MTSASYSTSEVHAMRRFVLFVLVFTAIVACGALLPGHHFSRYTRHSIINVSAAQLPANWQSGQCEGNESHWGEPHVCQMRRTSFTLPGGHLSVNTTNGGIDIVGEDRSDVALEARVTAWGPNDTDAENELNQVSIETGNGDVRDHGPKPAFLGRTGYSIDYHLRVPRHLAADLHTMNGGVDLAQLDGTIRFATTNGGVSLNDLSGDVQGHTVNGGLQIALAGDRWQGEGLRADTTNGGIDLHVPPNYSAHLETSTVNGGVSVDFPITIQGEIKNHLDTDLGSGGATIHAQTVNGGISVQRAGSGSGNED
jgi:DUF4097 and DUF4098 domain-containing protein YvlB